MSQLIQTYENYLQQPEALSFTEMTTIYQEILKNADMNDKDFIEIWEELMGAAIRYTVIRAEWPQFSREQKLAKDSERTNIHNTIIDHFILLERIFQLNHWDSHSWTSRLFLQEEQEQRTRSDVNDHRQRIGDFANYLVFVSAVNGR
ncbi:hypothetical protein P7E43_15800 [Enterococcus gallinarum]|uniref:hypothetical protein n=1 Tax=Enterococcus gallinarum TaxID=1353 RepID=UPI0028924FE7|nr:hypothetical protein [Enterococcus gallinarum]MDT2698485.1 hypothetical protein [Enterococcus gallinarum]MDT2730469.1 hypothetical protein [Enterococcus gallinarum]